MSPTFTCREQTSQKLDDGAILLTGDFILPSLSPSIALFPNTNRAAHVPCGCHQGRPRPMTRRSSPPPQGDMMSPAASASSFLEVRLPSSHLPRTISFTSPLLPPGNALPTPHWLPPHPSGSSSLLALVLTSGLSDLLSLLGSFVFPQSLSCITGRGQGRRLKEHLLG